MRSPKLIVQHYVTKREAQLEQLRRKVSDEHYSDPGIKRQVEQITKELQEINKGLTKFLK